MSLITPDDYRAFNPECELDDEPLQLRIDAIEAEILRKYGSPTASVQTVTGGDHWLFPSRPVSAVTSIEERRGDVTTTLAADDYEIYDGGRSILRVSTGTNTSSRWGNRVVLTYSVEDETAIRKGVILDLLDMDLRPSGLASRTMGEWSETYAGAGRASSREADRTRIMGRLQGGFVLA